MISLILIIIGGIFIFISLAEIFDSENIISGIVFGGIGTIFVLLTIITFFKGVQIKNNEGQYVGYVTSVEENGAFFKGYNVYLKTSLESSNEDKACINRDDKNLIERLKEIQETKENVTLLYEGEYQYPVGACPQADWMVIGIK